jgi:hypothetical protein
MTTEEGFLDHVADRMAALPTVEAVSLGGSRAQGTERPDSDWDLGIYYRGHFEPSHLRDLGWSGEVSEVGGWGGGVFNGGAWLVIEGRRVDVHYRDLASVEHELAESAAGRFRIEPLLFHLAGIPTYLVVAELALNKVLRGELPRPGFPPRLRQAAPGVWWDRATLLYDYAGANYAPRGRVAQTLGLVVQAASSAAHGIAAARGVWVTNEKTLLARAGLTVIDQIVAEGTGDGGRLMEVVDEARERCRAALAVAAEGI